MGRKQQLGKSQQPPNDPYCHYTLKSARLAQDYSLKELGIISGISWHTINAYERLKAFPSKDKAQKLADILNIDVEILFPKSLRRYVSEIRRQREGRGKDLFDRVEYFREIRPGIPDESLEDSLVAFERRMKLPERLNQVLDTLDYIERDILRLRFGLADGIKYTLEEVGEVFEITRERVRQIERRAIRRLQTPSRAKHLYEFLD